MTLQEHRARLARVFSPKEAAAQAGLSETQIYEAIQTGELGCYKYPPNSPRPRYKIPEADLNLLLDRMRISPAE